MSNYDQYTTGGTSSAQPRTEADAVAEIVRHLAKPEIIHHDTWEVPMIAVPQGVTLHGVEQNLPVPRRKRATVHLCDAESLIRYVMAHAEDNTTIFATANDSGSVFCAVLDYHHAGVEGAPQWGSHQAIYNAAHSVEWKRWTARDGKLLSQEDMARFIEDNRADIEEPDGATLLELVRSMEATSKAEFKSAVRLDNGDRSLTYQHTTDARAGQKGELEVPEGFLLSLPVFEGGAVFNLAARFRYRINGGTLQVYYELDGPHKVIDLAHSALRDKIARETSLIVLNGRVSLKDSN